MTVDELVAAFARTAAESNEVVRAIAKCRLVDELGTHAVGGDRNALDVLVVALADPDGFDAGSYEPRWELVAEHAVDALVAVGAPAERGLATMLAHDRTAVRVLAANGLQRQRAPHALDTIAALARCAADPDLAVRRAVGMALSGTEEALPLLDDPRTRLAGLVASEHLTSGRLVELIVDADREVRIVALGRLRRAQPMVADAGPLIACLADSDLGVARAAAATLGTCTPDDPRATAALYETSRRPTADPALAYAALVALAERPPSQLAAFVPQLVAWFDSTERHHDDVAYVLGALREHATPQVVDVLAARLAALPAADERIHHVILRALGSLCLVSRPAVHALENLARHPSPNVRQLAAAMVAMFASHAG